MRLRNGRKTIERSKLSWCCLRLKILPILRLHLHRLIWSLILWIDTRSDLIHWLRGDILYWGELRQHVIVRVLHIGWRVWMVVLIHFN